jgi:hypothetical protein
MKRIKSLLVLSILGSLGLISKAQVSSLPVGFTNDKNVWIVRSGVSLSNVSGSGLENSEKEWARQKCYGKYKNAWGGNLTLGLYLPFGTSPFYYGLNVTAGMRGFRTAEEWLESTNNLKNKTRFTAFKAQIAPTNVGYIVKLCNHTALDFHLGLFVSCDFAGSYKNITSSDDTKITKTIGLNDLKDYGAKYNKYDIGPIGGIGLWYNHWVIDLSYQKGISSIDEEEDSYSNQILLSLGYAF